MHPYPLTPAGVTSGAVLPPPPLLTPSIPLKPEEPGEAEKEAALCSRFAEEERLREGAESEGGCDYPDGPLSPSGCRW